MSTTSPIAAASSSAATNPPLIAPSAPDLLEAPIEAVYPPRRFSVAEYQRMARAGILTEDDPVELLEGVIVEKMPKYPPHDGLIDLLAQLLYRQLPPGWFVRVQNTLVTSDSQPEPDVVVTRGSPIEFMKRNPTAADVALVIEVADSSLVRDRRKRKIYARAGAPQYWIVDLDKRRIEKYAEPDQANADYRQRELFDLASPASFLLPDGGEVNLALGAALAASDE